MCPSVSTPFFSPTLCGCTLIAVLSIHRFSKYPHSVIEKCAKRFNHTIIYKNDYKQSGEDRIVREWLSQTTPLMASQSIVFIIIRSSLGGRPLPLLLESYHWFVPTGYLLVHNALLPYDRLLVFLLFYHLRDSCATFI